MSQVHFERKFHFCCARFYFTQAIRDSHTPQKFHYRYKPKLVPSLLGMWVSMGVGVSCPWLLTLMRFNRHKANTLPWGLNWVYLAILTELLCTWMGHRASYTASYQTSSKKCYVLYVTSFTYYSSFAYSSGSAKLEVCGKDLFVLRNDVSYRLERIKILVFSLDAMHVTLVL